MWAWNNGYIRPSCRDGARSWTVCCSRSEGSSLITVKHMQIAQVAELLKGQLIGDGSRFCAGANPPELASGEEITMLDDPKRAGCLASTQAIAVITPVQLKPGKLNNEFLAQIIVEDPHAAFAKIVAHFRPPIAEAMLPLGIDPSAEIDPTAVVHPSVTIGAG